MIETYPWKRFWIKKSEIEKLRFDRGYICDPEKLFSEQVVNLRRLDKIDGLDDSGKVFILLGDAGLGKTIAVRNHIDKKENAKVIDLSKVFNSETFNREISIIDKSVEYVYFDSFDECFNTFPHIQEEMIIFVDKTRNLKIRIVSRSSDWPSSFEGDLDQKRIGSETYFLQSLRRKDVESCFETSKEYIEFSRKVEDLGLQVFASKPITLISLINEFKSNGTIPETQWKIYEKQCLSLCEEKNEKRNERGENGRFSAKDRLITAGRIAIVMKLCNFRLITDRIEKASVKDGILHISEIDAVS